MIVTRLSTRDRRVLAIGTAIVLAILIAARGVPALRARSALYREKAAASAARAARAEWSVRNAAHTRRMLDQTLARLAAYDSAIVDGSTGSAASARLAELVSDAADIADARLGAVQLAADTVRGRGRLARVTARASVTGDLMAIAQVLQSLEQGPQLLAVRELAITSVQAGVSRGQRETLQADLLVEGLYRPARSEAIR
jgi:hypothetical protein